VHDGTVLWCGSTTNASMVSTRQESQRASQWSSVYSSPPPETQPDTAWTGTSIPPAYGMPIINIVDPTTLAILSYISLPTQEMSSISSNNTKGSSAQDVRTLFFDRVGHIMWACLHTHIVRINQKEWKVLDTVVGTRINCLVWVPLNDTVWACSSDSTIYVYARASGIPLRRFYSPPVALTPLENVVDIQVENGHKQHIFVLTTFDKYVWSGGYDKKLRVWDAQALVLVSTLNPEHDVINALIALPVRANLVGKQALIGTNTSIPSPESSQDSNQDKIRCIDDIQAQVWTVWSGAWDGTVAIWV